jgi:hypothetical protein
LMSKKSSSTGKLPQMAEALRDSRAWSKRNAKMPRYLRDIYGEIEARDRMLRGRSAGSRDPMWALPRPPKIGSKPQQQRQKAKVVVAVPRVH